MTLKELAPGTKVFHFFFGSSDLYGFNGSGEWEGRQLCKPPLGPISLISLQFSAKILSNNRFSSLTQWLVSSLRVGNPGSATDLSGILLKNICGVGVKAKLYKIRIFGQE